MTAAAFENTRVLSEGQKQADIAQAFATLTGAALQNAVHSAEQRHQARCWAAALPNGLTAPMQFAALHSESVPSEHYSRTDNTSFSVSGWKFNVTVNATAWGTYATGVLTFSVNPTDGDTLKVGATTYRFESSMTTAQDIQLEGTAAATAAHVIAAINGTGLAGTDFYAGTTSPNLSASAVVASSNINFTALVAGTAGNSVATVATITGGEGFAAATLLGAVDGTISLLDAGSSARLTFTQNATQTIELCAGSYSLSLANASGMTATVSVGTYSDGVSQV